MSQRSSKVRNDIIDFEGHHRFVDANRSNVYGDVQPLGDQY